MVDWAVALATFSKVYEGAKMLREFEKTFDAASFKLKIADLTSDIADLKIALTEARTEAVQKDDEIAALRKTSAFRSENTVTVRGLRFEKTAAGGPQGMPFCSRCDVVDGRLIRIVQIASRDGFKSLCPQCKTDYGFETGFVYERED